MVLLEFSMIPLGKDESISPYVARCLQIIERSGVDYRCHAMGTTLEGEFDHVMQVVKDCFEALETDCPRIECRIAMDFRKGRRGRLDGKVTSVEEKLGHAVRK